MTSGSSVSCETAFPRSAEQVAALSFALWPLIFAAAIVGLVIATADGARTAEQRETVYLQSGIAP